MTNHVCLRNHEKYTMDSFFPSANSSSNQKTQQQKLFNVCPVGQLEEKFGPTITDLFLTYYSKPSDRADLLGFTPMLKGPEAPFGVEPSLQFHDVKLVPLKAGINQALTHERIEREGERIMERVAELFRQQTQRALENSKQEMLEDFIEKMCHMQKKYEKNTKKREKELKLKRRTELERAKRKHRDKLERALRKQHAKQVDELKKYVHQDRLEYIVAVEVQEALAKQEEHFEQCVKFMVENKTKEIIENLELENEKKEKAMGDTLEKERQQMQAKLYQIEAEQMNDTLEAIVTERLNCQLKMNNLKKEFEESQPANVGKAAAKGNNRVEELEKKLKDERKEKEELQNQMKEMTEVLKQVVAAKLNQPLNQIDYLFQVNGIKCPSQVHISSKPETQGNQSKNASKVFDRSDVLRGSKNNYSIARLDLDKQHYGRVKLGPSNIL